jgi:DNA-binding NtrC family response regulator
MVQALVRARTADAVEARHLSPGLRTRPAEGWRGASRDFEKRLLQKTLECNGGNRTQAARSLGLSRQGLYRKLKRLGL